VAELRVDANVILRYLTDEPPEQAEQVARLFDAVSAGRAAVVVEDVVLAEVVWTLASYYRLPRQEIASALLELLGEAGVHSDDKATLQAALALYAQRHVDFADALLAARVLGAGGHELYTFDRDFDRIPGLRRRAPDWP
jgi:predicted nucleic-acid-binding protein